MNPRLIIHGDSIASTHDDPENKIQNQTVEDSTAQTSFYQPDNLGFARLEPEIEGHDGRRLPVSLHHFHAGGARRPNRDHGNASG